MAIPRVRFTIRLLMITVVVYECRSKSKYERAAARPWLPIEPEPPGPPER